MEFHLWPKTWTLRNYTKVFEQSTIGRGYLNSLIVAFAVTFLVLLSATMGGYLSRLPR